MRLYQQIRASIAHPAVSGALAFLFASGMPVSAFGQATQTPQPSPLAPLPAAQGTPLAIDDAVRMALENNLGIQTERLNPQIQVLGIARADAAYAPTLFSSVNCEPPMMLTLYLTAS